MNIKHPIAMMSTAVLTLALGACAHTDDNAMAAGSADARASTSTASAGARGSAGASSSQMGSSSMGSSNMGTSSSGSSNMGHSGSHGSTTTGAASAGSATAGSTGMDGARGPMTINSATEALALVATVDQMEIALSQQAKAKKVTGPVMAYADMMVAQHTPHLAQTRAMIEKMGGMPADGTTIQKLMAAGKLSQDRLGALQGDAYARAYVEHMVASHQHAIAMVDASMNVATDPAARDFMMKTRQALQMHLERAQQLQGQLGG
ncbi:DUF4142 domain-containing protein [Lysobacter korlensis]|uniref:DUF4142 domain-containing protein n=1 Tax=Lysobacter korlensis TaxID=553636 RepID=A0ABV6RR22_9GAMM